MRSAALAADDPEAISPGAPAPFLKWAGGKRQLLPQIEALLPRRIDTYFEPFLGGAALFFRLAALGWFKKAILGDANPELVNCYVAVRDHVDAVIAALGRYRNEADCYYAARAQTPDSVAGRAARLIYLNRCGYNGLFRVNSKGEFNVPFGRYRDPTICNEPRLRAASAALKRATIVSGDFADAVAGATPDDFVYFDPPYVPLSKTASFTAYAGSFDRAEQERLAVLLRGLGAKRVPALLSNSYTPVTAKLYRGLRPVRVEARRSINSVARGRGPIEELLVRSFPYPLRGDAR
jgi:DNA adenine methylase